MKSLFFSAALALTPLHAFGEPLSAGDLEITAPWSRASAGPARAAAGFMTIANTGAAADRLIAASADFAARAELHTHIVDGDIMRMRAVEGGIALPPGETVVLEPGGLHVMFMGLSAPLEEGEHPVVTLTFENAGAIEVPLAVGPVGAMGPASDDRKAHGH